MEAIASNERRKFGRSRLTYRTASISFDSAEFPIVEMSSGGFSAKCFGDSVPMGKEWYANILVLGGTLINNVPVKLAWKKERQDSSNNDASPMLGVEFQKLRKTQKLQIEAFIKWHTEATV